MTTPEYNYMERVFASELPGASLFQPRPSKMLSSLIDKGWVVEKEVVQRGFGGALTIRFVTLTIAGHLAYCEECNLRISDEDLARMEEEMKA